jgi:hypothetical protein
MMSFTADGQVDPKLVEARDAYYGIDTKELAASRIDMMPDEPAKAPADMLWRTGRTLQAKMVEQKATLVGPQKVTES